MGGTSGHVLLGLTFFLIGVWHLFNSIKHHALNTNSFIAQPWFQISRLPYLEPLIIMLVTAIFISTELFVRKNPISTDGIIPERNLPHLEHSIMAFSFFIYAFFAILFNKISPPAHHGLLHLLQAGAFSQQLLIIHLHSTDHTGVEGQYHWLFQIITFVCLATTLLAISHPESFLNSLVKASSVVFQGVWLIVMGIMLWTPKWLPAGCFLKSESGRDVVLCHGDRALARAKALVNLQFGLYLIVLTIFTMSLYLVIIKLYTNNEYRQITKWREEGDWNISSKNLEMINTLDVETGRQL